MLKIDNMTIERVDEFKFLRLTLDTNLNWKKNTEKYQISVPKNLHIE